MVRHGQTKDNLSKVYSRDSTPLTKKGEKQILQLKKNLRNIDYEEAYYSPLKRTVQTMKVLNLDGKEDIRIRETDFGIFTGKTFNEISRIYPEETKLWTNDIYNYRIPQGESLIDVYKRTSGFLDEVCKLKKNSLIITHDSVIRLALCWVFDNPLYFFRFKIDNGSINTISIDDGYKYIKELNQR